MVAANMPSKTETLESTFGIVSYFYNQFVNRTKHLTYAKVLMTKNDAFHCFDNNMNEKDEQKVTTSWMCIFFSNKLSTFHFG